jgi:hypothetical protein
VVLRARNSLLNTVLLYDVMLGARGARALDWVGSDLERVGPALELGNWYATRMGMRVGGDVYFVALLGALGHPDSVETARVRAVVGTYRGVVAAWLASRPGDAQLAAPETARLEQVWRALCAAIDSAVSAPVAARLRPMRDAGR